MKFVRVSVSTVIPVGDVGLKSGIRNTGGSIATASGAAARIMPVSDAVIAYTLSR